VLARYLVFFLLFFRFLQKMEKDIPQAF